MVDLVKVRKKAKEKKEKEEAAPAASPKATAEKSGAHAPPPAPQPPPVQPPAKKEAVPEPLAASHAAPPSAEPPAPAVFQQQSRIAAFLETANDRRTRQKEHSGTAKERLELLTFDIAGEHYAVGIENVVSIITARPVTRVPNADPSIVGIISLRGAIVTLIDVRRRLGHPSGVTQGPDSRIIVVQQGNENVGFQVDRVQRVVPIDADSVEPNPVVHASEQNDAVSGVFRRGDALTILIDLDKLLGGVVTWN